MQQGYYENHRDDMVHAHAFYALDNHCTPHFHNSVELAYVIEGSITATLDGTEHVVGPHTMIISSSYVVHSYNTPASSKIIVAIIPFAEVPSLRTVLAKQAFASAICPDDSSHTLSTLMDMLATHTNGNPYLTKGLSYTILSLLIERVGLTQARAGSRAAFIRDALEYLQQHHAEPLSAQSVAAHFGYSRSRFSHIFNAQLGYTLCEYLSAIRCRHAAQLLRESDMPVSDVAMAVGFESLRTFYRIFKKQYDMTPNRYAKS